MPVSATSSTASATYTAVRIGGQDVRGTETAESKPKNDRAKSESDQQQSEIAELKARDREVRAHEAAHLAASGGYARGGANFTYVRGPDGVLYATGGEVQIDTSPVSGDPEATIRKAETIRRAALAPANPSDQDRRVAAMATRMVLNAQMEVALQSRRDAEAAQYAANQTDTSRPGRIDQRA